MKIKNILLTSMMIATLIMSSSAMAFATTSATNVSDGTAIASKEISPRIYWHGTAKLYTGSWANITSSNNIFPDSPTVTSDVNNAGYVNLRVMSSDGSQIGSMKTVYPGESVVLDRIPALSGTYTIQGSADPAGTYSFTID